MEHGAGQSTSLPPAPPKLVGGLTAQPCPLPRCHTSGFAEAKTSQPKSSSTLAQLHVPRERTRAPSGGQCSVGLRNPSVNDRHGRDDPAG